ncbi:hypothetical protein C9374_002158 [Naegleria lovaniensis]|uniref:Uncharacterized protein n=1 Tax=Naegleria lovaniensis TaxID=51637 RepID=A0AA88GVK9_NAELO|nr:uncharacterized protein C9374_002158 [Naegleria lovaniensis]KAG2387123.1 hypothetical protein C9374_002158 [Naegleria lovaniensis]
MGQPHSMSSHHPHSPNASSSATSPGLLQPQHHHLNASPSKHLFFGEDIMPLPHSDEKEDPTFNFQSSSPKQHLQISSSPTTMSPHSLDLGSPSSSLFHQKTISNSPNKNIHSWASSPRGRAVTCPNVPSLIQSREEEETHHEGKWFSSLSSDMEWPRSHPLGHSSSMQHVLKHKMIMMMVYGSHGHYSDHILKYWMERYLPKMEYEHIQKKILSLCTHCLRTILLHHPRKVASSDPRTAEASSEIVNIQQQVLEIENKWSEKEKRWIEDLVRNSSGLRSSGEEMNSSKIEENKVLDETEKQSSDPTLLSNANFDSETLLFLDRLWKSEYIQEGYHSLMNTQKLNATIQENCNLRTTEQNKQDDEKDIYGQLCKHAEYFLNKIQEMENHEWTVEDWTHAMQRNSRINEVKLWYRRQPTTNSTFIKNQLAWTSLETVFSVLDITGLYFNVESECWLNRISQAIGGEKTKWLRSYNNVDGFLIIFSLDEISSEKHSLQTALHTFNEITQYFSDTSLSNSNTFLANNRTQIYVCFTESNLFCDKVVRGEYSLQKSLKGDTRNPTTVFKFIVAQFIQSNGVNGYSLSSNNLNKMANSEHVSASSSPIISKYSINGSSSPELLFFTVNDFSSKSDMYNFTHHLLEGKSYFEDRISGKLAKKEDEVRRELFSKCSDCKRPFIMVNNRTESHQGLFSDIVLNME